MNMFRHWVLWSAVETAPGKFDWREYDRMLDLEAQNGIQAVLAEFVTSAPEWAFTQFPEARFEAQDGYLGVPQYSGSSATGGFPGLCLDNPKVRRAEAFLRRSPGIQGQAGALRLRYLERGRHGRRRRSLLSGGHQRAHSKRAPRHQPRPHVLLLPGVDRRVPQMAARAVRKPGGAEPRVAALWVRELGRRAAIADGRPVSGLDRLAGVQRGPRPRTAALAPRHDPLGGYEAQDHDARPRPQPRIPALHFGQRLARRGGSR